MATCVLIDYLIEKKINLNIVTITLIEPSTIALNNGYNFLHQISQGYPLPNARIKLVNKYIDDLNSSDIISVPERIKVHLFSNIIDVNGFDILQLYQLILDSFQGINRFICISPSNWKNRPEIFYNLFASSHHLAREYKSNAAIYEKIYRLKSQKYEWHSICRHERQFTINLVRNKGNSYSEE